MSGRHEATGRERQGRFCEGQEQLPRDPRIGRFSDGQETIDPHGRPLVIRLRQSLAPPGSARDERSESAA
jgi:hypothetical protein